MGINRFQCGERVSLDYREAFPLPRRLACREVVCTDGMIWVTFRGDPQDYILKKGDRLMVGGNRGAIISGLGRSEFSLIQDDGALEIAPLQDLKRPCAAPSPGFAAGTGR